MNGQGVCFRRKVSLDFKCALVTYAQITVFFAVNVAMF